MKNPDRILAEVWKAKDTLSKRFGYDIHRLAEHFRRPEVDLSKVDKHRKRLSKKVIARRKSASMDCTIKG